MQYRLEMGGQPTSDSFTTEQAARRFADPVHRIGGRAAREVRAARSREDAETPTLRSFTERQSRCPRRPLTLSGTERSVVLA
ncbi:MAG TPA: hypothetical protein VGC57_09675 [Cellulomonas sp.]